MKAAKEHKPQQSRVIQSRNRSIDYNNNAISRRSFAHYNRITQFNSGESSSSANGSHDQSWNILGASGGIIGGGVSTILGITDTCNAIRDKKHDTYIVQGGDININNANGHLEEVGNSFKVKVTGNVTKCTRIVNIRKGPIGTNRRISEGILNTITGICSVAGGITTITTSPMYPALIYAGSAITSAASALSRFWRSRD